jgi:hypothetical protein
MFVQSVALPAVPEYARVSSDVLTSVLSRMLGEPARLTFALDAGFREMEREQPALATFVADEIAEISDPCLSALAYFLGVVLYLAFRDAFPGRLTAVQTREIKQMLDRLVTDGELRESGAAGRTYSEDAIAQTQPVLAALLRSEVERALEEAPPGASFHQMDEVYEALLVQLLVLSYAVGPQ